ncbi:formyl-CoA transferase [Pseudarthrobacter sulfonivorans]|uniref:Formyl-CoA transferase n=1 Tax=Pseudarthrobacter sulfonivorans TaxID=121292 RepID=A0A0U3QJU2_9MICC|nr:CoA transferase [Pseudarthrobacter sulfonivorans]ALV39893.1 formyl-CoA transferase [Pseudarthrobacter sulfonivorans]
MPELPLQGVRVLDMGQIYNAPYATLLMALSGAEVIKIEPIGGEHLRARGEVSRSHGVPFAMLNSNKKSLAIDVRTPAGREIVVRLTADVDVFVENFRPGAAERLGLGARAMREKYPRLVYASGSGFGQVSALSDVPAMDLTIQAMSGVMSITGFPDRPPVKAGPAVADFSGGIHLYAAIITALLRQRRTGDGAHLDIAMLDSVIPSMASNIGMLYDEVQLPSPRTANRHGGLAVSPYNVYTTTDGFVAIIVVAERHWVSMCELMGMPELCQDPRFATAAARIDHMDEVDELVESWTRTRTRDEVFEKLRRSGVPSGPVRELSDVLADPSLRARGALQDLQHPIYGDVVVPHSPLRFEGEERVPIEASHALGADTRQVLSASLGMTASEIDQLMADGIIR